MKNKTTTKDLLIKDLGGDNQPSSPMFSLPTKLEEYYYLQVQLTKQKLILINKLLEECINEN